MHVPLKKPDFTVNEKEIRNEIKKNKELKKLNTGNSSHGTLERNVSIGILSSF